MSEPSSLIDDLRERLLAARHAKGLSLSEAAKASGLSKPHIWELESGKSTNPTIETLAALAATYDLRLIVRLDWIMRRVTWRDRLRWHEGTIVIATLLTILIAGFVWR